LLFLFVLPSLSYGQSFPKEGSRLNYRIIGFSVPEYKNTTSSILEIAAGNVTNTSTFTKNKILSISCRNGKAIAEVPTWGSEYTWRMTAAGKKDENALLHYFQTLPYNTADTTHSRLRIAQPAKNYKDAFVFVDDSHALYDMNGNPVWFLPWDGNKKATDSTIRDLKITPQGTITFTLVSGQIYEVNYGGDILWKGPNTGEVSGDTNEHYHHEFTRLQNGHYMVLGNETVHWPLTDYHPDSATASRQTRFGITLDSDGSYRQQLQFGTVIEYNADGKLLWSWKSSDYFKNSDLATLNGVTGNFELGDTHENSFYFDEQNGYVYVSFRNISRILKLKYPEGSVAAVYGTKYEPGVDDLGNDMFCGQHSIKRDKNGYLYLFDNNSFADNPLPKVEVMEEPSGYGDTLKRIWEYQCNLDGLSDSEKIAFDHKMEHKKQRARKRPAMVAAKIQLTAGGNVEELADGSMFVSSCGTFSKLFVINKQKEVTWNAVYEAWHAGSDAWTQRSIYRASIIPTRDALEQLIWNSQDKSLPGSPEER